MKKTWLAYSPRKRTGGERAEVSSLCGDEKTALECAKRAPKRLMLPAHTRCFATPMEFASHHLRREVGIDEMRELMEQGRQELNATLDPT